MAENSIPTHYAPKPGEQEHMERQWVKYGRGYFVGCATKYLERYHLKNGIDDLNKAMDFTRRLKQFEQGELDGTGPKGGHATPMVRPKRVRKEPEDGPLLDMPGVREAYDEMMKEQPGFVALKGGCTISPVTEALERHAAARVRQDHNSKDPYHTEFVDESFTTPTKSPPPPPPQTTPLEFLPENEGSKGRWIDQLSKAGVSTVSGEEAAFLNGYLLREGCLWCPHCWKDVDIVFATKPNLACPHCGRSMVGDEAMRCAAARSYATMTGVISTNELEKKPRCLHCGGSGKAACEWSTVVTDCPVCVEAK